MYFHSLPLLWPPVLLPKRPWDVPSALHSSHSHLGSELIISQPLNWSLCFQTRSVTHPRPAPPRETILEGRRALLGLARTPHSVRLTPGSVVGHQRRSKIPHHAASPGQSPVASSVTHSFSSKRPQTHKPTDTQTHGKAAGCLGHSLGSPVRPTMRGRGWSHRIFGDPGNRVLEWLRGPWGGVEAVPGRSLALGGVSG